METIRAGDKIKSMKTAQEGTVIDVRKNGNGCYIIAMKPSNGGDVIVLYSNTDIIVPL
jgi:hypothetical protein